MNVFVHESSFAPKSPLKDIFKTKKKKKKKKNKKRLIPFICVMYYGFVAGFLSLY